MGNLQKPGEKPARSGEYIEKGDNKLPPTADKNRTWERIGPEKK